MFQDRFDPAIRRYRYRVRYRYRNITALEHEPQENHSDRISAILTKLGGRGCLIRENRLLSNREPDYSDPESDSEKKTSINCYSNYSNRTLLCCLEPKLLLVGLPGGLERAIARFLGTEMFRKRQRGDDGSGLSYTEEIFQ